MNCGSRLQEAGHNVTFLQPSNPNPVPNPNRNCNRNRNRNPNPYPNPNPSPSPGQVTFLLPSESLIIEDCKKIAGAKVGAL